MSEAELKQRLEVVFQDIFDDPALALTPQMRASDVEGWDSIAHVNLIVAVERAFKVKFTTAEVGRLANVGDLMNLIARKTS